MLNKLQTLAAKTRDQECPPFDFDGTTERDLIDFFTCVITPRLEAAAKDGYTSLNFPVLTYEYCAHSAFTSDGFMPRLMPKSICGLRHSIRGSFTHEYEDNGSPWANALVRWFLDQSKAEDSGIYSYHSSVSADVQDIYERSKAAKIHQILDTLITRWNTFDPTVSAHLTVTHSKGQLWQSGRYSWTTSHNLHFDWTPAAATSPDELLALNQVNKYRKKLRNAKVRLHDARRKRSKPDHQ